MAVHERSVLSRPCFDSEREGSLSSVLDALRTAMAERSPLLIAMRLKDAVVLHEGLALSHLERSSLLVREKGQPTTSGPSSSLLDGASALGIEIARAKRLMVQMSMAVTRAASLICDPSDQDRQGFLTDFGDCLPSAVAAEIRMAVDGFTRRELSGSGEHRDATRMHSLPNSVVLLTSAAVESISQEARERWELEAAERTSRRNLLQAFVDAVQAEIVLASRAASSTTAASLSSSWTRYSEKQVVASASVKAVCDHETTLRLSITRLEALGADMLKFVADELARLAQPRFAGSTWTSSSSSLSPTSSVTVALRQALEVLQDTRRSDIANEERKHWNDLDSVSNDMKVLAAVLTRTSRRATQDKASPEPFVSAGGRSKRDELADVVRRGGVFSSSSSPPAVSPPWRSPLEGKNSAQILSSSEHRPRPAEGGLLVSSSSPGRKVAAGSTRPSATAAFLRKVAAALEDADPNGYVGLVPDRLSPEGVRGNPSPWKQAVGVAHRRLSPPQATDSRVPNHGIDYRVVCMEPSATTLPRASATGLAAANTSPRIATEEVLERRRIGSPLGLADLTSSVMSLVVPDGLSSPSTAGLDTEAAFPQQADGAAGGLRLFAVEPEGTAAATSSPSPLERILMRAD